jgi:hypothetical protein
MVTMALSGGPVIKRLSHRLEGRPHALMHTGQSVHHEVLEGFIVTGKCRNQRPIPVYDQSPQSNIIWRHHLSQPQMGDGDVCRFMHA